ncbi:MAG: hypothetical protein Q8Q21_00585 [bacterium]|nr:hypothetical protein [bacterium]
MSPQNKISFSKIFLGLFFLGLFFVVAPAAVRAASYDVTGDAWSSNIGWIKFNHGKSNAVKYDDSTGKLSGYAWSSNIGWISFGETSKPLSASGDVGGTSATANTSTGLISGWARACAGTQSGTCSSMTSRTDGWDGWIKFDTGKSNPVKIDLNNSNSTYGDFTGYAWGSDVVGWVSFSGSNYKVEVGLPTSTSTTPTCSDGIQNQDETGVDTGGVCGTTTYKCVSNACVSVNDSGGTYPTQSACDSACGGGGTYSLTVNITGDGSGYTSTKKSDGSYDSTYSTKTYTGYSSGSSVSITASPSSGSKFSGGWVTSSGGNCEGGTLSKNNSTDDTCNLKMDKDKSVTVSFDKSAAVTPLTSPTGLSGSAGACGGNINLSWNSVTGAASYTLYRSGYEFSEITGTSYADSGLGTNSAHTYKVKACNSGGCSDYSPSISVTSSGECEADWYSLTFRTKGSGSGYAKFYYWQDSPWNNWALMSGNLSDLTDGEQASIGRDYKYKLTAMPAADSYFGGWSGCDSSSGEDCFLNENTSGISKTITAAFNKEGGAGGAVSCDPTVKIAPRFDTVTSYNTEIIYWYSAYADSCVPSGGGRDTNWANSSIGTSGSYTTSLFNKYLDSSRTYNITCKNSSGGSSSGSATINVVSSRSWNSPYWAFDAFPNPVTSGQSSNLYWIGTNCYRSGVNLFSPTDSSVGTFYNQGWAITTLKQWFGSIANSGGYLDQGVGAYNTGGRATSNLFSNTKYAITCKAIGSNSHTYQYLTVEAGVNPCGPSNVPPEVSLVCDPISCEGYYGSAEGQEGFLKVTYAATDVDDNIDSCEFEVDGDLESSSCNDNYYPTSVLSAGTHTVAMTATDKDGEAAIGSKTVKILERKTVFLKVKSAELYATIIDGLPDVSKKTTITTSGTCENISLEVNSPISGATVELSKTSIESGKSLELTVKSIPGTTKTGTYTAVVTGTGTNCKSVTVDIPINVENVSTRWEEF